MASWQFSPAYRFIIYKRDATGKVVAYNLRSMLQCTATLVTAGAVGQLDATFADPGQLLRGGVQNPASYQTGPTPHAMHSVELWLQNRRGVWGPAWAGYVDEVHFIQDPDQGQLLHLLCTSPYKLWEIVHVSPSDQGVLAMAFSENVSASSVLVNLSMPRVGYPVNMLRPIDPLADSGPGFDTSMIQTAFSNPEEQTWSAVIQALQASAGIEFYFDGQGYATWRRVAFQTPVGYTPRPVSLDDILHADLAESDRDIVTSIEVRWAYSANVSQAGKWPNAATTAGLPQMTKQLRERHLVVYAPWIQTQQSAQNLAEILGEQYSAGILQGSVTIPADPLYAIGNVVAVPGLYTSNPGGSTHYYLASVAYSLQWGAQWVMTLGLKYGRSPGQQYPYLNNLQPYPTAATYADTTPFTLSQLTALSFAPNSPSTIQNTFRVVADPTLLDSRTVSVDPSLIPLGSLVQIDDPTTHKPLGKASGGEYTAVDGQTGLILGMVGTSAAAAQVSFVTIGTQQTPVQTGTGGAGSGPSQQSTLGATGSPGTGFSTGSAASSAPPSGPPGTFALKVLHVALAQAPGQYRPGATGQTIDGKQSWDCSGLVWWAFTTAGYITPGFSDSGPNGEFYWFLAHGAVEIPVADAKPGDLLFCQGSPTGYTATQDGFGHVGWCLVGGPNATIYGANNLRDGLSTFPVAQFHDSEGHGVTRCLDMSRITPIR